MFPLEHLRTENLGQTQPPSKRMKSDRNRFFSLNEEILQSEAADIMATQDHLIRTKIFSTTGEKKILEKRIGARDPKVDKLFDKKFDTTLSYLCTEMLDVLKDHFRAQVYDHLSNIHNRNLANLSRQRSQTTTTVPGEKLSDLI